MEDLFLQILRHVGSKMPELALIDEDYGQLETDEDIYPVMFPCFLLSGIETEWTDAGAGVQKGQATVCAKLAFDCYHDTHLGSGQEERVKERLAMNNRLYVALQGFRPFREMGPLKRIKSREYSIPGGKKVYETVFSFPVHDNSSAKAFQRT